MLANRLKKNIARIKSYLKQESTTAYRLYDRDIPEYPFIIDVYGEYVIVYDRGVENIDEEKNFQIPDLYKALKDVLGFTEDKIIMKRRKRQKGIEQYEKLSRDSLTTVIQEGNLKFKINLTDYLDSGLFMDHRPLRKRLLKECSMKQVLNLFSYTSSLGVAAAKGGATTTNVDLSNTYLEWSKENYKLNDLKTADHSFIHMDVLSFAQRPTLRKWDIVIVDPPTFSNSKSLEDSFEVEDDHVEMIHSIARLLNDNGKIIFSCNKKSFKLAPEITENFLVVDQTSRSIPPDFRDQSIHKLFELTPLKKK